MFPFSSKGVGTSSYPCQDTYHGKKPFSEVEVASVARYLYGIRTKLVAYYNIHAYSQLWMTPWSYTTTYPRDYAEIVSFCIRLPLDFYRARLSFPSRFGSPLRIKINYDANIRSSYKKIDHWLSICCLYLHKKLMMYKMLKK